MNDSEMTDKRAVVTGGASGIGLAVVHRLLREGLRVAALDRRPMPLRHPDLRAYEVDITDGEQIDACHAQILEAFGGLDVLVSNAGIGVHERLDEGDPDKWAQVVQVNLIGAMRVIRSFTPLLARSRAADAVFVSSVAEQRAYPYGGAYAASKAGLGAVVETLRLELQPKVRVTTVRPGMVDTSFFAHAAGPGCPGPAQVGVGALRAQDVADAVWFALTRPLHMAINEITLRPVDQSF